MTADGRATEPSSRPAAVVVIEEGVAVSRGMDAVAVEEPLEVRLGDRSLLVTMRTPGNDFDLVRGLLFTEGMVASPGDVTAVAHCRDVPDEARGNVVTVGLAPGVSLDEDRTPRAGIMSSACGVCGKASLEALADTCSPVGEGPVLRAEVLVGLPAAMHERQAVYASTGGLHAAALFDGSGRLLAFAEDIGRHNAVDKVIGQSLRFAAIPLHGTILMVSGRAGFEIVQKARRAVIPVVCSVSAPSSLAVDVAVDGGQTLIGFLRGERFNIYAGAERLTDSPDPIEIDPR